MSESCAPATPPAVPHNVTDLAGLIAQAQQVGRYSWSADPAVSRDDLKQTAVLGVLERRRDLERRGKNGAFRTHNARWRLLRDANYRSRHAPRLRSSVSAEHVGCYESRDAEKAQFNARSLVARLLRCPRLSSRDRALLTARYGLDGSPPVRGAELASRFGVSKARIGQLLQRASAHLRCYALSEGVEIDLDTAGWPFGHRPGGGAVRLRKGSDVR